ncbi:MAG: hypothetical protein OXC98_04065 [bacterium]|nr:hypothetical protein [Acidimicrobiia bacterium]MCY4649527.1 hypothetical protein [bacterium]
MVVYPNAAEAKKQAGRYLAQLATESQFEWRSIGSSALFCEPVPQAPCQVMVFVVPVEGGFAPVFGFTVGIKHETRYWQGRIVDENGRPYPPETATERLQEILGVLIDSSRVSVSI